MPGQLEDADDSEHLDNPDEPEKIILEKSLRRAILVKLIKKVSPEELGNPAHLPRNLSDCAVKGK